MSPSVLVADPAYRGAFRVALIQQLPTALLCALFLDGGATAKVCGIALAGFWGAALVCLARRPFSPAASDLAYIRYGFFPVFACTLVAANFVST